MYNKQSETELIALTKELQELMPELDNVSKTVEDLRAVLRYHDWRYYMQHGAVISDYDYDQLFKFLKDIEAEHPELITEDSPTQRVAGGLNEDFASVEHSVPMLSLDNSYNEEDLKEFDKRVRDLSGSDKVIYAVEPKFDGSSIALLYENDLLIRAATRGNGVEGEEITNNAKSLRSIPLKTNFSSNGMAKVEVRGEVVIRKDFFEKMNEEREAAGEKTFQNARNTASGALRLKDSAEVAKRGLEAFIYQIGYAVDSNEENVLAQQLSGHLESISWLNDLGFKSTQKTIKKCESIEEVMAFCREWEEKRDTYPYEIDGMVIKVDDYQTQRKIGFTAHHPRWAIAFKFKAKQATTKLERIEYQVGRTGAVTPVAKLTPVPLAGVTISSVSLHNEDFIKEKDIRLGDTVLVERAGDVIPYIAGVVEKARTGDEQVIDYPKTCPSCESPLFRMEEEAVWRCVNANCPAQQEEKLIHFVSKGAMDIQGLGKDIIKRFIQEGFVQDIPGIYQLDYDQILSLEGWKERSVENLKKGIEASKSQPLWRLITGLGIRHVGSTSAKMLEKHINELTDYKDWSIEQFIELEDVGPKVAESLYDFFQTPFNLDLLDQLKELGLQTHYVSLLNEEDAILNGQTFLFTGTLEKMGRDEAKSLVEQYGGKNVSGVSAKLNYLVAGEKAGSKLSKAQKIESIKIITENDFLEMIGK